MAIKEVGDRLRRADKTAVRLTPDVDILLRGDGPQQAIAEFQFRYAAGIGFFRLSWFGIP